MMKLYISYYEDYVSVVEGEYKPGKGKYHIKSADFFSIHDIDENYKDSKYGLLRYALGEISSKSKNVVLCLNTKDIMLKSWRVPKVGKKDLDGMISLEIEDIISLDEEEYVFSYEVVNKSKKVLEQNKDSLDIVVGAIKKEEIEEIVDLFSEFDLDILRIDTLTTSYLRILRNIEYEDMMIANIGDSSTIINIYKEDSLFICDNIPIKISVEDMENELNNIAVEIKGLMDYYSSRNFGKNIETILILGNRYNNKLIYKEFNLIFPGEIARGITQITDIDDLVIGDIDTEDINLIVENLGCMIDGFQTEEYDNINFLTKEQKMNKRKKKNSAKIIKGVSIVFLAAILSYMGIFILDNFYKNRLNDISNKVEDLDNQYKKAQSIKKKISSKNSEIKIYDMLMNKEVRWGEILSSIDKSVPINLHLTELSTHYSEKDDGSDDQTGDNNVDRQSVKDKKEGKEIYNQIPRIINIKGNAQRSSYVGKFLYNLKLLPYFKDIVLHSVEIDEDNTYIFSMTLYLKEGAITNE